MNKHEAQNPKFETNQMPGLISYFEFRISNFLADEGGRA